MSKKTVFLMILHIDICTSFKAFKDNKINKINYFVVDFIDFFYKLIIYDS